MNIYSERSPCFDVQQLPYGIKCHKWTDEGFPKESKHFFKRIHQLNIAVGALLENLVKILQSKEPQEKMVYQVVDQLYAVYDRNLPSMEEANSYCSKVSSSEMESKRLKAVFSDFIHLFEQNRYCNSPREVLKRFDLFTMWFLFASESLMGSMLHKDQQNLCQSLSKSASGIFIGGENHFMRCRVVNSQLAAYLKENSSKFLILSNLDKKNREEEQKEKEELLSAVNDELQSFQRIDVDGVDPVYTELACRALFMHLLDTAHQLVDTDEPDDLLSLLGTQQVTFKLESIP